MKEFFTWKELTEQWGLSDTDLWTLLEYKKIPALPKS